MKTYSDSIRNALILTAIWLFLSGYTSSQAIGADPKPRHRAGSALVQSGDGVAHLIVRRDPGLGNFVWVQLSADGVLIANIGYGRTYEGFLPGGRHVLSLLPTPNPKFRIPWQMILDMRSGQTYTFTAMANSGHLILRAPGELELPRGR
jgi:hypothetical protein